MPSGSWDSRSRSSGGSRHRPAGRARGQAARRRRLRRGGGAGRSRLPGVPGRREVHRTDEIRRRLDLQGPHERTFEHSLAPPAPAGKPGRPGRDLVTVSDAEVEREFPAADRAGEGRVRARGRRALQGRGPALRGRGEGPLRGGEGGLPPPREAHRLLRAARTEPPAAPVAVVGPRPRALLPDHREEFRQEEEACASHILVKVKAGEAGEGHPDEEAKAIAQAFSTR